MWRSDLKGFPKQIGHSFERTSEITTPILFYSVFSSVGLVHYLDITGYATVVRYDEIIVD